MSIDLEQLRNLPIADKLRIVEQLWDDIANSAEPFPVQPWHQEEAKRRDEELERTPEIGLTRDELWERVDKDHA